MHPVMGVGEEIFLYAVPKQLGYFKAEGLDVAIENSQNGTIAAQVIQSNGAPIRHHRAGIGDAGARAGRRPRRLLRAQAQSWKHGDRDAGLADHQARGYEGEDDRCAVVRLGRRLEPQAKPSRYRHRTRAIYRDLDRSRPGAFAALRTGKIDALVVWDAMLGAAENTGMKLRLISIPLQDRLAGMTLATSAAFAKANPEAVAGYCRAMTKGLLFTLTNPEAAVRIFWEEFPTTKPVKSRRRDGRQERRPCHEPVSRNGAAGIAAAITLRRFHSRKVADFARFLHGERHAQRTGPQPTPIRRSS